MPGWTRLLSGTSGRFIEILPSTGRMNNEYFGPTGIAPARARRREELVAIFGSLTLLCNLVMAWMTRHIQMVLDNWHQLGRRAVSGDVLRHVAPARSRGINFRGTMDFPLGLYRERLIPTAMGR